MKHVFVFWWMTFFLCTAPLLLRAQVFDIRTYGAVGDGVHDDAASIQQAIDACARQGGGRVVAPAGHTYLAGPFHLASFVELYVESGARILADSDERLYTQSAFGDNLGEGTVWIGGEHLRDVRLDGGGVIDGNGIAFMGPPSGDAYGLKAFTIRDPRPHLLTLVGCTGVRIRDLTIQNSAYWTLHLAGCTDVVVSGISVLNSTMVRNSDGIDLDHSRYVRISDCRIESGDDAICLKNRREYQAYGPCAYITVTNCILQSSSCAFKIGSENVDSIHDVVVDNCLITGSNRGIGIQNRDEGSVSDVSFSNITLDCHLFSDTWWGKAEPIYVTAFRRAVKPGKDAGWRLPPGATAGKVGPVRRIRFSRIQCQSENGIYVSGESPDKISDIVFEDVSVSLDKVTAFPGGVYDRRPAPEGDGLVRSVTSGFCLDGADSVSLYGCRVVWGSHRPSYFGYVLDSRDVLHLDVGTLRGNAAVGSLPRTRIRAR